MLGAALLAVLTGPASAGTSPAEQAAANAEQARRAVAFCHRYAHGWLSLADPAGGLLPRNVQKLDQACWNAWDCAADNYPFIVLTAFVTDQFHLRRAAEFILEQEQRLTNRVGRLPDTFCFRRQGFHHPEPLMPWLVFGAAEYAKDGLLPIAEWLGESPWLDRMEGLLEELLTRPGEDSPVGPLPSLNDEVNGDLLEVAARLCWIRRDARFRDLVWRLGDYYLQDDRLLGSDSIRLRDHGSEVLGGLSEAYVLAAWEDPARRDRWKPRLHALLDRVLEVGANEDGMLFDAINPATGEVTASGLADTWGYVYNAFLTVAMLDDRPDYRAAVEKVLRSLPRYRGHGWEGQGIDGVADAVEGAINLLNRVPVAAGFEWVDDEIERIYQAQGADGVSEGWYGDGNSARTALMYALWKSLGISASPWRQDLQLGAVRQDDGTVVVFAGCRWAWSGRLRFDRPRHRDAMRLPLDYPRINQFPEWFTVEPAARYLVQVGDDPASEVEGSALRALPLALEAGQSAVLRIRPVQAPTAATQTAPAGCAAAT